MEKALKAVYDVHRQTLLESNQSANKFKGLYERITEKYKKLQKDYELLSLQNKHLQDAEVNKQNRGGDCCGALRSSLETIGTTYKQLIEEKDNRIRYLEDELRKYKRRSASLGIGSLDFTQDSPVTVSRKKSKCSSAVSKNETSPDSTSRGGNNETGLPVSIGGETGSNQNAAAGDRTDPVNNHESGDSASQTGSQTRYSKETEEDLVFVDKSGTQSHQQKLKLQKGRLKRSRYTENISPENKRQRKSSSSKSKVWETHRSETVSIDKTAVSNDSQLLVLVPDTCQPNLDETQFKLNEADAAISFNDSDEVRHTDKKSNINKNDSKMNNTIEHPVVQVVPETLPAFPGMEYSDAEDDIVDGEQNDYIGSKVDCLGKDAADKSMDVLSDTDESDSELSQCTVRERNKKITELSMRSILKSTDSQRNKSNVVDETDISKQAQKSKPKGNTNNIDVEKNKTGQTHVENILDSPVSQSFTLEDDNESAVTEFINHKTLNLSGESEVFELDSDTEYKAKKSEERNAKEVDCNEENSDRNSKSDRPSSRKFRKDTLIEENHADLRRSPRKLKEVQYYETPKKSKRKLKESSQLTESEIHEMFSSPTSSSNDDVDMTLAPSSPPKTVKNCNVGSTTYQENHSMEYFNVVPVKNGVPISRKKIQIKVPKASGQQVQQNQNTEAKNRTEVNKEHDDQRLTVDDKEPFNLKSPSIIADKAIAAGRMGEVVISSPSVSSVTDPESPLLLQGRKDKILESERAGSQNDEQSSGWIKARNKSVGEELNNKNMDNQKTVKKSNDSLTCVRKSTRVKSTRNLCQTTLTQAFLRSPSKKCQRSKMKGSESDIDHDLQEAIRLSLEEAQSSQTEDEQLNDADVEVLDFGTEKENTPPFKRPNTVPRPSLRRRNKPSATESTSHDIVASKTDDNLGKNVLKEVIDNADESQIFNSQGQELNGSIDPAAQLSVLCAESNSLQSLPSLEKDFQFEELNQGRSLPKTSTLAEEDSQEIVSSSRSIKFGTKKKRQQLLTGEDPEEISHSVQQEKLPEEDLTFDTSFDHVPKKKSPEIAHVAVVRKRDERQKLKGHSCRECYEYYKAKGVSEEEIHKHIQQCSRHRAKHVKPDTPPHFWSVGFIDTQECVDRGYMKIERNDKDTKDGRTFRRRRALEKRFKAKNETSLIDSDQSDLEL